MSAQVKGLLVTAAIGYALIIAYHKGLLPLAAGAKKSPDGSTAKPGE